MPNCCFEVMMDVQRCIREDITVEVLDNCLTVNLRKCASDDCSIVARKFSKRIYPLPLDVEYDKDSLKYEFDKNGMLRIQIFPKKTDNAAIDT